MARLGMAWRGQMRLGRRGVAWRVRHHRAWHGEAGKTRLDVARQDRTRQAWLDEARHHRARQGRQGVTALGWARQAGQDWARQGRTGQGRAGKARQGRARHGRRGRSRNQLSTVKGTQHMGILNINSGGGSYIRFAPSANAWMFGGAEVQLKQIVFDHESVRTGWGKMAEGSAPEWVWDEQLGVRGKQPSEDHRRGFSIMLYAKTIGVANWSSNGTGPCMGFDVIFEQIWNERDANPGKVPVVEYTGSELLKIGKGNTRKPQFRLVKWVPRENVPWDGDDAQQDAAPAPKPAPVQKATAPASSDDDVAEF